MNETRSVLIDRQLIDSIIEFKKDMDRKEQEILDHETTCKEKRVLLDSQYKAIISDHEENCKEKRTLLDSQYKAIEEERDALFKKLSDLFMDSPPGEPFNMFEALRTGIPSSYNFTDPAIGKEAEERTEQEIKVRSEASQRAEASREAHENDKEVDEMLKKFEGGTRRTKSKTLKRRR